MPLVQVIQSRKSLGIQDLENIVNSQIPVGAHMLGSLLDYPAAASSPSGEVQYLQIKVTAGVILDDMQYFLETGGSASRNVRMGLYEQADPTDRLGIPTNRVAQTNQTNTTGAVDQFKDLSAQQASAISSGLMAQNRTQRQNLESQAKLGDPNAMAALQQFELDSDMKTAQVMTQQASDYNNALAGLNMQRAGMYGQAGQVQLGFEQQAQALNQAGVAMQQSAIAQAANFEAQGLAGAAQMVAANPYNPVAFLPTLMAYFQFGMTEGSGSFPGFSSEFLGAMA